MFVRGRPSRSIVCAATISAWVESRPPETPMTILLDAGAGQPLHQAVDLDVVRLVAALVALGRVVGHVGEALHVRASAGPSPCGHLELERRRGASPAAAPGSRRRCRWKLVRRIRSCAQPLQVDVGGDDLLVGGEPLGLGQQFVVLVDQRVAVPGQVGRRFARPGGGVEIRGDAACRTARRTGLRRYSALPMVMLLAERFASTVAPASAA